MRWIKKSSFAALGAAKPTFRIGAGGGPTGGRETNNTPFVRCKCGRLELPESTEGKLPKSRGFGTVTMEVSLCCKGNQTEHVSSKRYIPSLLGVSQEKFKEWKTSSGRYSGTSEVRQRQTNKV